MSMRRFRSALILAVILLLVSSCVSLPDIPGLRSAEEIASEEDRFVTIDGHKLRYSRYDSVDGLQQAVFLHGFLSHLHSFDGTAELLTEELSLYGYDRLAFGLSSRPIDEGTDPYTTTAVRMRLKAFLDRFALEQVILIGNSAGGNLAVQAALAYPERVKALILIDPAIYRNGPPGIVRWILRGPLFDRFALSSIRDLAEDQQELFESAWYRPELIGEELKDHYLQPLQVSQWDRSLLLYTKATEDPKIVRRLKELEIPTLIIHGREDRIVPVKQSIRLHEELANSQLVILEECGHVPHEELPEQTAELIRRFISEL